MHVRPKFLPSFFGPALREPPPADDGRRRALSSSLAVDEVSRGGATRRWKRCGGGQRTNNEPANAPGELTMACIEVRPVMRECASAAECSHLDGAGAHTGPEGSRHVRAAPPLTTRRLDS